MDYSLLRKKIITLLNVKKTIRQELSIYDYSKAAFENLSLGVQETDLETSILGLVKSEVEHVVVSLTTYSKRIEQVHIVIESLFRQTRKANRILLWLSEDEFSEETVPLILRKQMERGLEIHFCKDIKSYKKLLPTLGICPFASIITVDDDFIYPIDFIEKLLFTSRKNPNTICYYRGSRILLTKQGEIAPYLEWHSSKEEYIPSLLNFPTGAGGVLYPPNCFHADVMNDALCMQYAPFADDLWFKVMTLLVGVPCVKVPLQCGFDDKFILLEDMQDIALYHRNAEKGGNDVQLKKLVKVYPVKEILRTGK